ncbi:centrosomal protein of 290 kDa isoform X2 [Thamnophis elegans]|uniref:centrosomal protein of 290 kDa isoform X2 n=1 Tax=Thamnophis elegans TaxID=35005 RepID=UPI0013776D7E|nr:centrosomal protein of 290 kDa isoform X2 [Thamnophis elegans]
MAPILEWKKIMRVDPDALPRQEDLADSLLETVAKVDGNALKDETSAHLIQLFKISQSLMKMKNQEVELALEEVEKAGEEQAKFENQLKTKVMKLEKELEIAQRSTGSRDTRFLRDEIRQLEKQLSQKDRELADMEKDLDKEKKVNEQLTLQNEETENENSKLRRENEQLHQDVIDYQRQLETQKETLLSRRGEDSDYRSQLSKKNFELVQYLDEIQNLTEANEKLEGQNKEMRKNLEESVQEMENMTDEYNKMKFMVQQSDIAMDQLRKEKEQYRLQVHELTDQLKAKNEEDDPLMIAVNEKVEEWKRILASKDDEIIEYQEMLLTLKEKLKMAQLDSDKSNVLALQQGVQERDSQIKLLTEQIEQYTKEMEKNVLIIEDMKRELQKDKSGLSISQQDRFGEMQGKLQMLEEKVKDSERTAELAEADAREKDKELIETLKRVKDYETGIYGLEDAVAEIKGLKKQLKIRNSEIETLIKEVNKLAFKINDLLDENEDLREQLGLDPKTMIDLTELKNSKALKQQQYKAENQVLLKEIETLEEERVTLKQQIRKLAQEKGRKAATLGLDTDDLQLIDNFTEDLKMKRERSELMSTSNFDKLKTKNDYLAKELNEREKDLEQNRTVIMKLKSNLKELVQENKHLQQGMKEILQAIKDLQKDPGVKDGESALMIPSLERLVNAIELKNAEGAFDASLHFKAQVDQLTGRNEELRKELRESRKEAVNFSNQLAKASTKIANLENEIEMLKKSESGNIIFKSPSLPEGMSPSSVNIINSQNEYLIHLLQEFENKELLFKKLEEAIEEYKRKFAVIRHQQGLLYKEYQSEREHWKVVNEKILQEKKRLEYQKEEDDTKIKEYTDLLDALEKDTDDTKQLFADYSRKITVLKVKERSITRQYTTLLEMERHLRKENDKMKTDMISMEVTVREKIGSLQRFKEMATFKIAALQKALDDSVPLNDLEMANKQYNDLTAKYRDMLQKDNLLIQRTNNMEHLEHENTSLKNQIESLNKELEITKEKLHTIEQAWEQTVKLGDNATDKATKAITNSEIVSISKKITMLEMKELNERQRAEHCQRMYEHLRNTLKQAEERNIELEAKFAELTKINLEAQKVEQSLRDELSNSVSKGISEVDKRRIMELEKSETELKIEISKLKELSDIAKTQVTALENRQQSRDKEVESLRMQILDYQVQSDEKTLIAKLHQHIVALQVSEATAITKLAAATSKLQNTEITNMRLEQKLDDKEQALYYARLEGKNRVKHLRQTIQSLRRQFSGALPLAQQEKFSKTMIQLQNDKLKTMEDIQQAQQERRNAENRAVELEMKLKGIEELVATLKDARGAQKVIEWHVKIEELRLQELKLNRELSRKNEEIKYLKNILSEYEQTINHLEEEIVQQGQFHEERQMAWDKREVELERQLDIYDSQKQDILSTAQKFNEAAGTVPDPTLSLPHQLEQALKTVREQSRTILEMQATCKSVEEKLKEKEATLWKAEQNILLRDKVINELRLQLPASSEREKLVAQLDQIDDNTNPHALKIAHQTIANMQARLNQKEEILKKYQNLLAKAREEQEEIAKKHEEDLRVLHQKLDVHVDSSFNKFKQTALELIQKPSLAVPASKHLIRVAELEQTIAEQDSSLNSLLSKLKKTSSDLQKQKQITAVKINEFDNIRAQLEEKHQCRVKKLQDEIEDLRSLLSKMGKELLNIKSELEIQRQANNRSPTTTMKNLVERLKNQLALKEKQQKALSKALLELRAEMTAAAEQQIISVASQKEAHMNVQQIVDKHTKELRSQIEDLNDQLLKLKDALKLSKNKENSLLDDMDDLNQELQKKTKAYTKVLREKDDMEKDNEELKNQNKRLTSSIQGKADEQSLIDELQRKIKRMETELGKKSDESEKKNPREDRMLKSPREELIKWEECKKWQTKADGMRNKLKEKEKEIESLSKQLNTMKELFSKAEKEKNTLQKKLKSCSVTVDHVMGVRASESERELEELRKQNMDLENEVVHLKTQYAVPRDAVVEDLHLKNRYLQEKLLVLEKQLPRDTCSRPSTSGIGSDDQHQKEQELQKENLILSSENMELRFQLEQANKDLPRLKNQVADLKEMCELLKREKGEAERKLGNVRGAGRSGKTIPELEKTIGLMKKVVERVQRENEELKRAPGVVSNEKVARLEQENEDLRSEMEKLKLHFGSELSARYELKTKGTEKIIAENDRIRKELKKEVENAEKLRMAKNNLEIINEKLNVELEETTKKLNFAESRIPKLEDADTKNWKSIVITRMFENKLKEMESEIARKNQIIRDLKQKLQKPTDSADKNENCIEDYLTEQADVLKSVPGGTKTEQEYVRENQLLRLPNDHLEKENGELIYLMESSQNQRKLKGDDLAAEKTVNYKLVAEVTDLKTQLKSSDLEQQRLHEEIRKLKNELDHFDPAFFEEIEDLKYNYNEEVKKNIVLEEKLKTLSEKFGVQIDIPGRISID